MQGHKVAFQFIHRADFISFARLQDYIFHPQGCITFVKLYFIRKAARLYFICKATRLHFISFTRLHFISFARPQGYISFLGCKAAFFTLARLHFLSFARLHLIHKVAFHFRKASTPIIFFVRTKICVHIFTSSLPRKYRNLRFCIF